MTGQLDIGFDTAVRARVAGVDEAGRGPLAGAVYAAAVVLHPDRPVPGVDDSKKLKEGDRERLAGIIRRDAECWHVAWAGVEEIDRLNILQATLLAMRRAVEGLARTPGHVLVDGNRLPRLACPATAIVGGDALEPAISAASILAKVARDDEMRRLDREFPGYGFARHKGYGTKQHLEALRRLGPCPVHRRSFAPVSRLLADSTPA